ncbi:MBL fold metallo-hydrolase [Rhodoplanes sp. TEM]|uniref:MBL fold metallo-hydrolase n=1 Tax=Rhodoplanes tepidamans TaxID=200616 RepID=A0ABT5J720_RHOTP|nr:MULTISPECIES: MBL fold metallo-hydrolase [Rhodoplanes]MDC7785442.1 MBL fold metallo-hydrolase [Rhodoplanes tepidamans]MDC7985777.1 MBL fold metallo-hydrolase [Rhodoplanes sp. TEM]MDQ0353104.1 7,8-dihydropterin-6-yl-methyl-4-(beta-D-ribofuranosyl)aminobenzene 5'-phosphate synthase [Rhodoplanes tepidamans]
MKVTVAMDNNIPISAPLPLTAEHGAAFLIEIDGKTILYDTGQTGAVTGNIALLGKHPQTLDMVVISHGHYDHVGGLVRVLQEARKDVEVVMHAKVFGDRYSVAGGLRRPIGVPYPEDYLRTLGGVWDLRDTPRRLTPRLWFSGSVPRVTDFEFGDAWLVLHGEGGDVQDPIDDDAVLFCEGERGLIVIGGCSHSGLVNIVKHGFAVTGMDKLQGWVGGTHLGPVSKDQQDKTIAQLVAWEPEFVAANHCTGFAMMARLKEVFGKRFIPAFVGESIVTS